MKGEYCVREDLRSDITWHPRTMPVGAVAWDRRTPSGLAVGPGIVDKPVWSGSSKEALLFSPSKRTPRLMVPGFLQKGYISL